MSFLEGVHDKERCISDILVSRLAAYGAIMWHKNKHHSFYIKFKDVRLGSIRIANHRGREKYHYTYEVFRDDPNLEAAIENVVQGVMAKSRTIRNFDPQRFVVYDKKIRAYKEVKNLQEYRNEIFCKTN